MMRTARAWQLAVLLSGVPYLQSLPLSTANIQNLNRRNELGRLLRTFSSTAGFDGSEMSRMEEIEFYLYTDSIDNKLIQAEFSPSNDPFSSSSRGIMSRKGAVMDSSQLDSNTLQLMIRKETENAIRSASLFGGLLSVLFSRDIWYAASSFLIVNIFATQSNGFGTITRIIGARIDLLMREICKIGRLLTEFCFNRGLEENTFKETSSSNISRIPRKTVVIVNKPEAIVYVDEPVYEVKSSVKEVTTVKKERPAEKKYYYDLGSPDSIAPNLVKNISTPKNIEETVSAASLVIPAIKVLTILTPLPPPKNVSTIDSTAGPVSTSNPSRIPLGTLISSAAKSTVTIKSPVPYIPPPPSAVYAATASLSGKVANVGGVSEAVINATVEVKAAADAASERLKIWLLQQRKFEEQRRREKILDQLESNRGRDTSKERKDLLLELSLFVTSTDAAGDTQSINSEEKKDKDKKVNSSIKSNMAVTNSSSRSDGSKSISTVGNDTNSGKEGKASSNIFSKRAIDCSVGTIHDFIAVLVTPGKNTLKQRYRHLTMEFHPDSVRNVNLPKVTVNSLMANLTGAFNYLSGTNSLSADGTLLSLTSPWGTRYTGGGIGLDTAAGHSASFVPSTIRYPNKPTVTATQTPTPKSAFDLLRSPLKGDDDTISGVKKRTSPINIPAPVPVPVPIPGPIIAAVTAVPTTPTVTNNVVGTPPPLTEESCLNDNDVEGPEQEVTSLTESSGGKNAKKEVKVEKEKEMVGENKSEIRAIIDPVSAPPITESSQAIPPPSATPLKKPVAPLPLSSTYKQFPSTGPPRPTYDEKGKAVIADTSNTAAADTSVTASVVTTPLPDSDTIATGVDADSTTLSSSIITEKVNTIVSSPFVDIKVTAVSEPLQWTLLETENSEEDLDAFTATISMGKIEQQQAELNANAEPSLPTSRQAAGPAPSTITRTRTQISDTLDQNKDAEIDNKSSTAAYRNHIKESPIGSVSDSKSGDMKETGSTQDQAVSKIVDSTSDSNSGSRGKAEIKIESKGRKEVGEIDWEEMKFRGSDIYSRAQGGVEGGKDFRNSNTGGAGGAWTGGKKKSYAAYIPPVRKISTSSVVSAAVTTAAAASTDSSISTPPSTADATSQVSSVSSGSTLPLSTPPPTLPITSSIYPPLATPVLTPPPSESQVQVPVPVYAFRIEEVVKSNVEKEIAPDTETLLESTVTVEKLGTEVEEMSPMKDDTRWEVNKIIDKVRSIISSEKNENRQGFVQKEKVGKKATEKISLPYFEAPVKSPSSSEDKPLLNEVEGRRDDEVEVEEVLSELEDVTSVAVSLESPDISSYSATTADTVLDSYVRSEETGAGMGTGLGVGTGTGAVVSSVDPVLSVRAAYVMAAPQETELPSWVLKGARRLVSSSTSSPLPASAALLPSATRTVSKNPVLPSLARPYPKASSSSPPPPPTLSSQVKATATSGTPTPPASPSTSSLPSVPVVSPSSVTVPVISEVIPSIPSATSSQVTNTTLGSTQSAEYSEAKSPASSAPESVYSNIAEIPSAASAYPLPSAAFTTDSPALTPLTSSTATSTPQATDSSLVTPSTVSSSSPASSIPVTPLPATPYPPQAPLQSVAASISIADSMRNTLYQEETEGRARTLTTTVTDIIFGPLGKTLGIPLGGYNSPTQTQTEVSSLSSPVEGGQTADTTDSTSSPSDSVGIGSNISNISNIGGNGTSALPDSITTNTTSNNSSNSNNNNNNSSSSSSDSGKNVRNPFYTKNSLPPKPTPKPSADKTFIDGYSPATAGGTAKRAWQVPVSREGLSTSSLLSAASPSPKLSPTLSQLSKKRPQISRPFPPQYQATPVPPPVYTYPAQLEEADAVRRTYGLVVDTEDAVGAGAKVSESSPKSGSTPAATIISNNVADPQPTGGSSPEQNVSSGVPEPDSLQASEERRLRKEAEAKARTEWVETVMARAKGAEIRARKQEKISEKRTLGSFSSVPSKAFSKEKNSPWPF